MKKKLKNIPAILLIFSTLFAVACNEQNPIKSEELDKIRYGKLALPSGRLLDIRLAITFKEQAQGLSGVKSHEFSQNQGLLFIYPGMGPRSFWMPDTYFDLDIIFLDDSFKIVYIVRNLPHHPGRQEPPKIARTPNITAKYVLEIRSDSPWAKEFKEGLTPKWISSYSLSQIESKIRPYQ